MRHRFLGAVLVAAVAAVTPSPVSAASAASPASTSPPAVRSITGTGNVTSVSCPSATLCWAAGWSAPPHEGFVDKITDGIPGPIALVAGTIEIDAMSCPTTTFCEAIGDEESSDTGFAGLVAIRNGRPGKFVEVPGEPEVLAISCSSAKTCEAVGEGTNSDVEHEHALVSSVSNGKPAHARVVSGTTGLGSQLDAVSCPTSTSCVAVGTGDFGKSLTNKSYVVRISGGHPGAPVFGVSLAFTGISCYSATSCEAIGFGFATSVGAVVGISDGSPGAVHNVAGSSELLAISCRDANLCQGSGNVVNDPHNPDNTSGVVVTISGGSPSSATKVAGVSSLEGDSCPVGGTCASGGSTTNDPGQVGAMLTTAIHPKPSTLKLSAKPTHAISTKAPVTLTLTVSRDSGEPRPTGDVTFTSGDKTLCKAVSVRPAGSGARAICKARGAKLGRGKHTVKASYGGDASYLPAAKTIRVKVVKHK